ncbi:DUF2911 domain-containing protein [Arenibacter sp. GZD96]|uniref:DUF2911 domain-containing protein n=1 Tax=Aurantibrevibacter litoralis TaxID=3106030 RepID=UPI002AFFCBE0|nr:DUF2911 domain-containing protein [Arenibacter sp. GZD-96]MEA1786240.1 DUF2911 domain-containing protein [Arenibacter sp. GZD-96]
MIFMYLCCAGAMSQINHPKASPFSQTQQSLGLATITVAYSRPAVKARQIWGALVPYGRIWRVGANESTKFTTDSELYIMGHALPPGTYALYAFPEAEEWTFIFHKNTTHWGDGRTAYNPDEDAIRVRVVPEKTTTQQENFLISFDRIDHNSMDMILHWDYRRIRVPIHIDTDDLMEREIANNIKRNPTAQTYYEAARYLQEQGKDASRALSYLQQAIRIGGDTYYFYRVKSLVEAELKNYSDAIKSAQKSLELAEAEGKDEFVRMNQENIAKWKKLIHD